MKYRNLNIPDPEEERIVVLGAGFAGLNFCRKLSNSKYQIVLIDRNNFHQFQPLFYQVAMAGLEPSAIAFPIRKVFHTAQNVYVRQAEILEVNRDQKNVLTSNGSIEYDYLIVCIGAETNFYGNSEIEKNAFSLKSLGQALGVRNQIFSDFEKSMYEMDYADRQSFIDFVIVGGGPTGVEMAGALAEMKKYVLPKDYPELNKDEIDIYLVQSGNRLLPGMSEKSGIKAEGYLRKLGVRIVLNDRVCEYDGEYATLKSGSKIRTNKLIWAAGIKCPVLKGLKSFYDENTHRIQVDGQCRVKGLPDIFAIGDIASIVTNNFPRGHPQVAQVGIQMGDYLAEYFTKYKNKKNYPSFRYRNKGVMATIGRNKAVADFPNFSSAGFITWVVWLAVHLFSLIGVRNKIVVMFNWMWNYFHFDSSLRLIIHQQTQRSEIRDASDEEEFTD